MTETELKKFCADCGQAKSLGEFSSNGKNADGTVRYYSKCRPCSSKAVRASRAGNKDHYAKYQAARSAALRELALRYREEFADLMAKHMREA